MDSDFSRRAHRILMQVLELEEPQRAEFIRAQCCADPQLQAHVDRLLRALNQSSGFLETPALGDRRVAPSAPAAEGPRSIGGYHIVRVIGIGNATVEVNDDVLTAAGDVAVLEDGTDKVYAYIVQTDTTMPYAASIGILDDCGETGSPNYGGPAIPTATPTPTNTPTITPTATPSSSWPRI